MTMTDHNPKRGNPFEDLLKRIHETERIEPDEHIVLSTCATCGGIGTIAVEEEAGIPGEAFPKRKFVPCPDCEQGQQRQQEIWDGRMKRTKLPERYIDASFRTWGNPKSDTMKGKVQAYLAAREFAQHAQHHLSTHVVARRIQKLFENYPPWVADILKAPDDIRTGLVLYGKRGVGKTWIAAAAMNHIAEQGEYVLYMRMSQLIQTLRDTWKSDEQTGKLLEHYCEVPVLFIDDMSDNTDPDEPLSPHMQDFAATIMRARMGNFLPTIITTNWEPTVFVNKWGGICADVVLEGCHWIPVEGLNLRNISTQWGTV